MRGGKDDPFRNKTVRRTVVVTHTCIDWPQGLITDGLGEEEEERGRRRPLRDEGILFSVTNSYLITSIDLTLLNPLALMKLQCKCQMFTIEVGKCEFEGTRKKLVTLIVLNCMNKRVFLWIKLLHLRNGVQVL